jgi:hypothetical protein
MADEKSTEPGPAEAPTAAEPEEATSKARFGFKLLDEAKRAKEQAQAKASGLASKAGELTNQATSRASELTNQATSRAGELRGQAAAKVGEVKDQVSARTAEIKDAGFAKLLETVDDFNASLPVLREAGYALSNVDIQIGLPPKIVAGFSVSSAVTGERVEALLQEHAEKKFTVLLMKALYQAWRLQTKIKIVGLQPKGLQVEIGLTPTVTAIFGKP